MEHPFGQPTDAVVQFAYAVPDLTAGMRWWTDQLGVGPWFVNQRIGGEGSTYNGEPGNAEFTLALAFSGHMMVELVQTLDDEPSIYKDAYERHGYGFHHVAKVVPDVKAEVERREASGAAVRFHDVAPGGDVFFLDGGEDALGMIELVQDNEITRQMFTSVWRASVDWNGARPVRDFAELLSD
ncbi:VOC family protein [Streptomyces caniscabiei]|uniref:VOC family protein n=1 Tax=Streptomyces caniscabiei TaxID=2746961 RepID=A0ABU4MT45_9ACTN|nr:VOC family protein [Streptomyces caniscabiei]MBE4737585.1 VOC family protein [Streptomyces caniscabiei]MBE4756345.1 VOC family protein [Streptomyces caniscabiei]MBE4769639.1 VOC family protein [Streptomyces caniscabiei]MBE4787416.1 VOC family protein [Streptomyces caniscabiei]MBE4795179.1 VOC family protein [Streptomyces caniscabiei]